MVKHQLDKYPETPTVGELKGNVYVNDWITGWNTPDDCLRMIQEANDNIFSGSLPLMKGANNHSTVNDRLQTISEIKHCPWMNYISFRVIHVQFLDKEKDSFVFNGIKLGLDMNCKCYT